MLRHMQKYLSKLETVTFWLVVLLLVFIPLYPKIPFLHIAGTYVAVRFEDILIAFVLLVWGVYMLLSKKLIKLFQNNLIQALIVFFLIGLFSLFSAVFLTQTVAPHLGILHYLRRVEFMMLLPVVITVVRTKKQLKICLVSLIGILVLTILYALGQQYLNFPIITTNNSELSKGAVSFVNEWTRVNAMFAGHYDLAIFLMSAIVLLVPLFFFVKRIILKLGIVLIAGISFYVLVLTASRLSFVSLIMGIVLVLFLLGKKKYLIPLVLAVTLVMVFPNQMKDRLLSTVSVNLLKDQEKRQVGESDQTRPTLNIPTLPRDPDWVKNKKASGSAQLNATAPPDVAPGEPINTTDRGVYRSFAIRLDQEWPRAIRAFYKNPFLGTGYSSLGLATDNTFLRSLGEVGLLGTTALFLLVFGIIKVVWKSYCMQTKSIKYVSAGMIAVIVSILVNGLFFDVFEASKIAALFWMGIGIAIVAGRIDNEQT